MQKKIMACFLGLLFVLAVTAWGTQAGSVAVRPNITDAKLKYLGSPEPEMDIIGMNFGATQGTKNIKVDGTLITSLPGWSMIHWSNTTVTVQAKNIIPWEHIYKIALTDGGTIISNVLSKRFLYTIDGIQPTSGLVNSTVSVYIWNLPAAPGGLVLKLGSVNFTILSWGSPIKAKVPAALPGTYSVYLLKGSDIVSNKVNFTVIKLIKPPLTPVEKK
jgi:hypothetical protein